MNYINENISHKPENNFDNKSNGGGHWEKYKVYYLVFGFFLLTLIIFLLATSGINRRLSKLEGRGFSRFFGGGGHGGSGGDGGGRKDSDHVQYKDHEFKFPNPAEQQEDWYKNIYQESVQEQVKENFINEKYLSDYQTDQAIPTSKNIIFYGPPGTGKTHYANLLAQNEACCYTEFAGGQLGGIYVTSARGMWEDLLRQVRKNLQKVQKTNPTKPAIIIINEIDAMLHKEKPTAEGKRIDNSLFTTFLQDVETIVKEKENIIILGTTNNLGSIEESAIRQGRFGCQIKIPRPQNEQERQKLIDYLQQGVTKHYKTATNREKWKNSDETKIVEFPSGFWEKIRQHNEKITARYQNVIDFSFIDFEEAVKKTVLKRTEKNSQKIVLDADDYAKKLTEIAQTRYEALQEKSPVPLPPLPPINA